MNGNNNVILLVEDNHADVALTLRAFKYHRINNEVVVARDGVEALEFLFCEGPHASRRIWDGPKLVLLDLKLPRVDGLTVLQRMKEDPRTKTIPVVVMTSSQEQSDLIQSYALGVNSYIVKPVNFERFAEAVRQLGFYWLLLNQPPVRS